MLTFFVKGHVSVQGQVKGQNAVFPHLGTSGLRVQLGYLGPNPAKVYPPKGMAKVPLGYQAHIKQRSRSMLCHNV